MPKVTPFFVPPRRLTTPFSYTSFSGKDVSQEWNPSPKKQSPRMFQRNGVHQQKNTILPFFYCEIFYKIKLYLEDFGVIFDLEISYFNKIIFSTKRNSSTEIRLYLSESIGFRIVRLYRTNRKRVKTILFWFI